MPFTGAHPMAVLPLLRWRRLDPTCLVIGAMAPDFEYFVHGELAGNFGHTLRGIILWSVPVTLLAAYLFHALVKPALALVAPVAIARRIAPLGRWPTVPLFALVVSAVIGDLTHLGWDGFTHAQGWGERYFPHFFDGRVTLPVLGEMIVFRVFQYASSVVGLVVVTIVAVRAIRRRRAIALPKVARARARVIFIACTALAIAAVTARVIYVLHSTDPGSLVVAPISGLLAGTLVASVLVRAPARAWRLEIEAKTPAGRSG